MENVCLKTVEMHAEGDPVRLVVSGGPELKGDTLLQKRRYASEHLESYRKLLIQEPRGHYDMYGAYFVKPDDPTADIACVFITANGYGVMCGHALMSIGRYAVDKGLVKTRTSPETEVVVQCPGGTARVYVEYKNGVTGRSRVNSVPAFVHSLDVGVDVPGYGHVTLDISYGGVFYAILPASQLGLTLGKSRIGDIIDAAMKVSESARKVVSLEHPEGAELAYVSGTILTDGDDGNDNNDSSGVCVYSDRQVPRAPCGTGVTARMALMYARGQIKLHQTRIFRGPAGSKYIASAIKQMTQGSHDNAIIVELSGRSYYTGECTFTAEESDTIGKGFLIR